MPASPSPPVADDVLSRASNAAGGLTAAGIAVVLVWSMSMPVPSAAAHFFLSVFHSVSTSFMIDVSSEILLSLILLVGTSCMVDMSPDILLSFILSVSTSCIINVSPPMCQACAKS